MILTPLPDTRTINRDTLKRALKLSPDAPDQDINTALLQMQALGWNLPLDSAAPGGPNLDGELIREVMGQPNATNEEVNSFFEQLADRTNPDSFKALSASAPDASLRFKPQADRTAQDEAENIRQRLGISREAWNKSC